jgi:DNA-binding MarR family transcriptional regulator
MTSPRRLVAPASACASPVCIGSSRLYEQALKRVGLTQQQPEVLASLITAAGPVRPTALVASLMAERSTISRNPALMQNRGWVAAAETSATGRAMSVTTTDAGIAAFVSAGTAWRRAPAGAARALGAGAASVLDQQLGLAAAAPASGSNAETLGLEQQSTSRESPRQLGGRADAGRADAGFRHVPDCGHPVGGWHAWR